MGKTLVVYCPSRVCVCIWVRHPLSPDSVHMPVYLTHAGLSVLCFVHSHHSNVGPDNWKSAHSILFLFIVSLFAVRLNGDHKQLSTGTSSSPFLLHPTADHLRCVGFRVWGFLGPPWIVPDSEIWLSSGLDPTRLWHYQKDRDMYQGGTRVGQIKQSFWWFYVWFLLRSKLNWHFCFSINPTKTPHILENRLMGHKNHTSGRLPTWVINQKNCSSISIFLVFVWF